MAGDKTTTLRGDRERRCGVRPKTAPTSRARRQLPVRPMPQNLSFPHKLSLPSPFRAGRIKNYVLLPVSEIRALRQASDPNMIVTLRKASAS